MISLAIYSTISVVIAFFVYLLACYISFRAECAKEYEQATEEFYRSIDPLVSDDETPVEMLELIEFLNETISDKTQANALLRHASKARWSGSRVMSYSRKINTEFLARRTELEKPFFLALMAWFRAITALSPIKGQFARIVIQEGAEPRIASELAKSRGRHDNHENGAIPAV